MPAEDPVLFRNFISRVNPPVNSVSRDFCVSNGVSNSVGYGGGWRNDFVLSRKDAEDIQRALSALSAIIEDLRVSVSCSSSDLI